MHSFLSLAHQDMMTSYRPFIVIAAAAVVVAVCERREMHREELRVFVAFHRWKSRDESVQLCRYHRYQDWWTRRRRTHTGPLSKNNLGPLLQRWPRVSDRVSSHSRPPQRLDAIRSQLERRWFVAEEGVKLTEGGKSASRGGGSPGRAFTVQLYDDGAIQSTAPGGKSYKKEGPYAWDRSTYSGRASESHAESKSDFTPMMRTRMMMQSSTRRPASTNQLFSRDIPIVSARDLSLLKTKGKNLNIDELM